jgi:hypothetical protein
MPSTPPLSCELGVKIELVLTDYLLVLRGRILEWCNAERELELGLQKVVRLWGAQEERKRASGSACLLRDWVTSIDGFRHCAKRTERL